MHRLLAPLVGLLCCCVLQLTLQQNQERVFAAVKDLTETVANLSLPAEDGVVVDQTWADNKVRSLVTCPVVTVLADEFPDCHAAILQAGYCDGSSFCGTSARLVAFISPVWLHLSNGSLAEDVVFVVVAVFVMALGISRGYSCMRA